jgi:alkyl sulfatase BDS1-like metallo-beta-lactamase superfamily hydrolase
VYVPRHLRGDWENYGQVESHVRQVYNGTIGWFGGDVYDINPLSENEEAARTVRMMGGRAAVQKAAAGANAQGGLANWRWTLKLTSVLLDLDPADTDAQKLRAAAARALGQRTRSANARGFYLTEALQLEGSLKVQGQPMTLDAIRTFVGSPGAEQLAAASVDENLQFVRYLIDPRKAEGLRQSFTLAIEGDPQMRQVELRNGVIVISEAQSPAAKHIALSRQELAAFVLGTRPASTADPLTELNHVLDRSHLMPAAAGSALEHKPGVKPSDDLEH